MFDRLKRDLKIITTKAFRCPGCEKYVPKAKLRLHQRRAFCPHCGAVVIAPTGEPVGLVAGLAPPPEAPPPPEGGVLATLGFLFLALDGVLIFYLFWFSTMILTAAIVENVGLRPIGWEAKATGATALLATGLFIALTFPAAILATRRLPGVLGASVAIGLAWIPVVAGHVFVVMPWEERASHSGSWPQDLTLTEFSVCASSFSLSSTSLGANGRLSFEIQNRGNSILRQATFTISAGRRRSLFSEDTRHRRTIRDLAPGERRRIAEDLGLGLIRWENRSRLGGPNSAGADVLWDHVEFADGTETLTERPESTAVSWIPDCPGAKRPALPWAKR